MLSIGLTGGIGSGKSSATAYFSELGVPVIDADQVARELLVAGSLAVQQIAIALGAEALNAAGELNRQWLRAKVFADPAALAQLEAVTHPIIRERLLELIAEASQNQGSAYVLVDIPLLFEKNYQDLFAAVVVVDCTEDLQLQRAMKRDGSDLETIQRIMSRQIARHERLVLADHVLDNNTTLTSLYAQINQLHQLLLQRSVDSAA